MIPEVTSGGHSTQMEWQKKLLIRCIYIKRYCLMIWYLVRFGFFSLNGILSSWIKFKYMWHTKIQKKCTNVHYIFWKLYNAKNIIWDLHLCNWKERNWFVRTFSELEFQKETDGIILDHFIKTLLKFRKFVCSLSFTFFWKDFFFVLIKNIFFFLPSLRSNNDFICNLWLVVPQYFGHNWNVTDLWIF